MIGVKIMKQLKQRGMAVIEYAVLLAFVTSLGFVTVAHTGIGDGVAKTVKSVARMLARDFDELIAGEPLDPEAIPDKENGLQYAMWIFNQLANRLMYSQDKSFPTSGSGSSTTFEINGTKVLASYSLNNTGTVAYDVPEGAVKSIKISADNQLYLYDADGKLLNEGKTDPYSVVGKDVNGETLRDAYIFEDDKNGLSYEINLTRGVVTVSQKKDGVKMDTIVKLSGYDFDNKDSNEKDSIKVSYSNYTVHDGTGYIENKVISGMTYTNPDGDVTVYLGTDRDKSEGSWQEK